MGKFLRKVLFLIAFILGSSMALVACDNSYKNITLDVKLGDEVQYNQDTLREEFYLNEQDDENTFTITAQVSGTKRGASRGVDIFVDKPNEVLSSLVVGNEVNGVTTATFTVKNGGNLEIKIISKEGGQRTSKNVFVVVPINSIEFNTQATYDNIPIMRGEPTDIINHSSYSASGYNFIKYTPEKTNQRNQIKLSLVQEHDDIQINGSEILVAPDSTISSFEIIAYYDYFKQGGGVERIQTQSPIRVNVLNPFSQPLNDGTISIYKQLENEDIKLDWLAHSSKFALQLATNKNDDRYKEFWDANLAFKEEGELGNINILTPGYSYKGTQYSIDTYKTINNHNIIGDDTSKEWIEINKVGSIFDVAHRNIARTVDIHFYVNYAGYEGFFDYQVVTVQVSIVAFPEKINVYSDSTKSATVDSLTLYNNYNTADEGGSIYVELLAFNNQEETLLHTQNFSVLIENAENIRAYTYKDGKEVIINSEDLLPCGSVVYFKNIDGEEIILEENAEIKIVSHKVEYSIPLQLVEESVAWGDGNHSAELYFELNNFDEIQLSFNRFSASWLSAEGALILPEFENLKAQDFKVEISDESIIKLVGGNALSNLEVLQLQLQDRTGATTLYIRTPNGYMLTINITVLLNLTHDNIYLSFAQYTDDNVNYIQTTDGLNTYTFNALIGDRQTITANYDNNSGTQFRLDNSINIARFVVHSSNTNSVEVENSNQLLVKNYADSLRIAEITVTIDGYSWSGDITEQAPATETFEFKFFVKVTLPISNVQLGRTAVSIYTKDTLNAHDFDNNGIAGLQLQSNPSDSTTFNSDNVRWLLFLNLESAHVKDITTSTENFYQNGSISNGSRIYWQLSEDKLSLDLWVELLGSQAANINQNFQLRFFVVATVSETYTDFYGEEHIGGGGFHSARCQITATNAVLIKELTPDLPYNVLNFDLREMGAETVVDNFRYFDRQYSSKTFNYTLNPANPQNNKLIVTKLPGGIEVDIDEDKQEITITILQLGVGDNYSTPKFNITISSVDSRHKENPDLYGFSIDIVVKVQDGVDVSYEIRSEADLVKMREDTSAYASSYTLLNNIQLQSAWIPIGTKEHPFTGEFFGYSVLEDNSKVYYNISNVNINHDLDNESNLNVGFFGYVKGATIDSVTIKGLSVNVYGGVNNYKVSVGSLVGYAENSAIVNCKVEDENNWSSEHGTALTSANINAIKATNSGIIFSYSSYNVNAFASIGGLVGTQVGGLIYNSISMVRISTANNLPASQPANTIVYAGGLVGYLQASHNDDDKAFNFEKINSIISEDDNDITELVNVYYSLTNTSNFDVVTLINVELLDNTDATNQLNDNSVFGGVIGFNNGVVQNVSARSMIFAKNNIGGLAGVNAGIIASATLSPNLYGNSNIGGAVGINANDIIADNELGLTEVYSIGFDNNTYKLDTSPLSILLGAIYNTKVQLLDYKDSHSIFNTAIAGTDNLGGVIGLHLSNVDINNTHSTYDFSASMAYNSVYSYVSNTDITSGWDVNNTNQLYYGDIVVVSGKPAQAIGGYVGAANNIFIDTALVNINISNNSNVGSIVIGGMLGKVIESSLQHKGIVLIYNSSVSGYIAYTEMVSDNINYLTKNQHGNVGGFIGDGANIYNNLTFNTDAEIFEWTYNAHQLFGYTSLDKSNTFETFYHLQASYTIMQFYSDVYENVEYVKNFVGKNANKLAQEVFDKYGISIQKPTLLTANSFYIGFQTYARQGSSRVSQLFTFTEELVKNGGSVEYFILSDTGQNILYIDDNGMIARELVSNSVRVDENGNPNILGQFYRLPSGDIVPISSQASNVNNTESNFDVYNTGWHYDSLNMHFLTASVGSENSGAFSLYRVVNLNENNGLEVGHYASVLDGKNLYMHESVNNGWAIQLAENAFETAVSFIADLPSTNLEITFKYDSEDSYQSERQDKTFEDVNYNEVDIEKLDDVIVLSFYQVDTNILEEIHGFYDFNGDRSQTPTQTERIYTNYLNAYLQNLNRYKITDILNIVNDPIYLSYSELNFYSNSANISIEYADGEVYLNVLGSGIANIYISSKYNLTINESIQIKVINKISNLSLYGDMTKTHRLSESSPLNVIKNYDKQITVDINNYLHGVTQPLIDYYGNITLSKNTKFGEGVRLYVLNSEGGIYHSSLNIPQEFSISGQKFTAHNTGASGWLVYVDCYDISTMILRGHHKANYKLMALPFVYEKNNTDVVTLIAHQDSLIDQGEIFAVNIIEGTFGIGASKDGGSSPTTPANFEVGIETDDITSSLYITLEQLERYLHIYGLQQVYAFEGINSNITTFDKDGHFNDVSSALLFKMADSDIINLLNAHGIVSFTFDKFVLSVTNLQYLNANNQVLFDAHMHDIYHAESASGQLSYKKYYFRIHVEDRYLYDIASQEEFLFNFYTVKQSTENEKLLESVISDKFKYTITPAVVEEDNVTLTHYSQITLQSVDTASGQQTVITEVSQQSKSNTLIAGYPGLLNINLHPAYARVDYLTVTSSVSGGISVALEQMLADYTSNTSPDMYPEYIFAGSYSSIPEGVVAIDNGRGIRLINNSYSYVENNITKRGYNGNFYIKTLLPSFYNPDLVFTITVVGYLNGGVQFTKTLNITPHLTPFIDFNVNGETDVAVAIGQEVQLTFVTDGMFDPTDMFEFFIDNEATTLSHPKTKEYLANGIHKIDENKYSFNINFDRSLIGKNFSITVKAYNIINNNKYEVAASINFQLALFTVQSISVDRVADGMLQGNFNQDYPLEVKVHANYYTDDSKRGTIEYDTLQKEILREIDKLSALITSSGLYGRYRDFSTFTNEYEIIDWQKEITKFGDTTIDNRRYTTSTWFYDDKPLTVNSVYHGFEITNGRAKFLLSDMLDPSGNAYLEPYAVLNVRSTAMASDAAITARAFIQYNAMFENGVGLLDYLNVEGSFIFQHESVFGFDTVQLSNEENPEPIYNASELRNMVEDGHYILMEDIEVNYWQPLSTAIASLDGNGYVIRINSFMDFSSEENEIKEIGLFGVVQPQTTIKNLIVEITPADKNIDEGRSSENLTTVDLEITLHSYAGYKIGIIAGQNNGTITNSMVLSNADSYRMVRDDLLLSNGKLTELELQARKQKYFQETVLNSSFLYNLGRTSTILKVNALNATGSASYRVAGFVGVNNGFITNSAVENITILSEYFLSGFVCENNGNISSSYFKGGNIINSKQDTIGDTQDTMGTAGFVVINNAGAEINFSYVLGRDTNDNQRDISGLFNGSRIDRLVGYEYTFNTLTNDSHGVRMFGSVISSVKFAGGFVYRNEGLITNSYVNTVVLADESGGFVYINTSSGVIKNTYAIATIYKEEAYSSPFSGVTTDKESTVISLDAGVIENSYYLKIEATDYQEIYEEYYREWLEDGILPDTDLFLGETMDGDIQQLVNIKYTDTFSTNTISNTSASALTLQEFGSYTSFATFSFNEDYENNGESVANSVWFIPQKNYNTANTSQTIARYFKHQSYKANIPQLVSANLKTTSIRYSNFIKYLPQDAGVLAVLDTLFSGMHYDQAYNIQRSLASLQDLPVNKYVLLRLLYEYPNRLGATILNEYSDLTGDRSYMNDINIDTIEKKLAFVFGSYSITDNKEQLNAPTGQATVFANLSQLAQSETSLKLLINAINTINSTNLESASSYYYSYITRDNNNVDISYGGGVLNPYLINSVEKFNTYVLQINTQGEETTYNQSGALRLIKNISYNNTNELARTYRTNFFGDFDGNGLYINDLRIIADNEFEEDNKIEFIGLFGTIGENNGQRGHVRNLNIHVQALRAAAVKHVGVLAGEIYNGNISNINVTANSGVKITGLNVVGGIAGRIYGDNVVISNVSAAISVHANYFNDHNNFTATNYTNTAHKFNLYNLTNISEVAYAGGIAGIMEARGIVDEGENAKINANIRGNEVYGSIEITGEVVGGLYGYLGSQSVVSHSRLIVGEETRLNASAVVGGLVGQSLGIITKSAVENSNQLVIDNQIYELLESDTYRNISTIDIDIANTGAVSLYMGNPHYMGGVVGVSLGSIVRFTNNRVDVANINAKYAGGVIGLSIGTGLSNIYSTASAYSFTAYGGLIGLQTRFDNANSGLINADFDYFINNQDLYSQPSRASKNLVQMESVVAATIWKPQHKVLNRSNYGIDAPRAQIGSFIGRALSYKEGYAYYQTDSGGDIVAGTQWYDFRQNTLTQRVQNESVFFMQAYQENKQQLIYEIGNATSNAVNLLQADKKFVQNGYHEIDTGAGVLAPYFMVVNAMEYVYNNVAYAYSGDISTEIAHENDYEAQYYRYSRLQNYGSLRTLKEIYNGVYNVNETAVSGLEIKVYAKNSATNYANISQEYDIGKVLENTSGASSNLAGANNPLLQPIYNNWRRDTWFGITMVEGRREFRSIYLFPSLRTKVYQEIIYVYTLEDLTSNIADFPSATYIIMADINLTTSDAKGWEPLATQNLPFSGTLKTFGNYKLYNLRAKEGGIHESFGLFAYTDGATFNNIRLEVNEILTTSTYAGTLVGNANRTTFQSITITSTADININTNAEYLGGVVGSATDCIFEQVRVNDIKLISRHANVKMGGVVGLIATNEAYDYNLGKAFNSMEYIYADNIHMQNDASLSEAYIGGLVGRIETYQSAILELRQATYYGNIIVNNNISQSFLGGLVGGADYLHAQQIGAQGTIRRNTATTYPVSQSKIGGLIGVLGKYEYVAALSTSIAYAVNNFDILLDRGAGNYAGGLVGEMRSLVADEIRSSYSTGTISIVATGDYAVGGLFGMVRDWMGGITIFDSYAMSKTSVFHNDNNQVGGVVGKVEGIPASEFDNVIYIYDFMPNSNAFGKHVSALELRNADIDKLKEYGLESDRWEMMPNSYPLLRFNIFEKMQLEGSNQRPKVTNSSYFGENDKAIILTLDGDDLVNMPLNNKTLYLTGLDYSNTNFNIFNTSVVFGLNAPSNANNITNEGIIVNALFDNQTTAIDGNGYLVYSRIHAKDSFPTNIRGSAYFSYITKTNGLVSYFGAEGQEQELNPNNIANVNDFIEADFDFENIWTIILGDNLGLVKNNVPIFRWEVESHHFWTHYASNLVLTEETIEVKITSAEDLVKLANYINGGGKLAPNAYVILTNDINLANKDWTPIGTSLHPFSYAFEGDGYTISHISSTHSTTAGLFGVVENTSIKNLIIKDSLIMDSTFKGSAGIIASTTGINNSFYRTYLTTDADTRLANNQVIGGNAGGFVGLNTGNVTINESYNNHRITYGVNAGGFVGTSASGKVSIINSYLSNGDISDSQKNRQNVIGKKGSSNVGVIVGTLAGQLHAETSYNSTQLGKIIGNFITGASVVKSDYFYSLLADDDNFNAIQKSSNQLQTEVLEGFNWSSIWSRSTLINNNYPSFFTKWASSVALPNYYYYVGENIIEQDNRDTFIPSENLETIESELYEIIDNGYEGVVEKTILIYNAAQLSFISKMVNIGYSFANWDIKLIAVDKYGEANNINLGEKGWYVIGYDESKPFSGNMYGWNDYIQEYTTINIENMAVTNPYSNDYLGMFGYVLNANISYINLSNAYCRTFVGNYVGNLIGKAESSNIDNIIISGDGVIVRGSSVVGGVVGFAKNTNLTNITNYSDVISDDKNIGGITGLFESTNRSEVLLVNLTNHAEVSGVNQFVGGIIGQIQVNNVNANLTAHSLTNYGFINHASMCSNIGGITGAFIVNNIKSATIHTLHSQANILGINNVGGLIGELKIMASDDVTIQHLTNQNLVEGSGHVAGIIGKVNIITTSNLTIHNVAQYSTIKSSTNYVSGVFGDTALQANNITIYDIEFTSSIQTATNTEYVGGVFAKLDINATNKTYIYNVFNSNQTASINGGRRYIGGIAGIATISSNQVEVADLHNNKSVTSGLGSDTYVGGIFGELIIESDEQVIFDNLFNTAQIKGQTYTGGIAGKAKINVKYSEDAYNELTLKTLHNSGDVISADNNNYIGGVFGFLSTNYTGEHTSKIQSVSIIPILLHNLYNAGTVTGGDYIGGLIGFAINVNIAALRSGDTETSKVLNAGEVNGVRYVGGFVGAANKINMQGTESLRLQNTGNITSTNNNVGGIIGQLNYFNTFNAEEAVTFNSVYYYLSNQITHVDNLGNVLGINYAGGIAGTNNGNITYVQNYGNIVQAITPSTGIYVGGITGATRGIIEFAKNNGNVTGYNRVGGITGVLLLLRQGEEIVSKVLHVENNGTVTATINNLFKDVGGLIGYFAEIVIQPYFFNTNNIYFGVDNNNNNQTNNILAVGNARDINLEDVPFNRIDYILSNSLHYFSPLIWIQENNRLYLIHFN